MLVSELASSEAASSQVQPAEAAPKLRRARGFHLPDGATLPSCCTWLTALEQVCLSVMEAKRVARVQQEKAVKPCRQPSGVKRASNHWLVEQILEKVAEGPIKRMDLTRALGYNANQLKLVIKDLIDQKKLQYVNASKASKFIKLQLGPVRGDEHVDSCGMVSGESHPEPDSGPCD